MVEPAVGDWSYEVSASPHGDVLTITASFPAGNGELSLIDGAGDHLKNLVAYEGTTQTLAQPHQGHWAVSCEHGCRVNYTYLLRESAIANDDRGVAYVSGLSIEAPPSTWLLRPIASAPGTRLRLHVTSAPGDAFAAGLARGDAPDTYVAPVSQVFALPYSAFGELRVLPMTTSGVDVAILSPGVTDEAAVREWANDGARALRAFYGTIPTSRVLVLVQPSEGEGVGYGSTMGWSGAAIDVSVGQSSTHDSLHGDWTLVHELVHTALPNLDDEHHWLEEGLASYVEPLARARVGLETPQRVWRGFVRGMPFGRPASGDRGLDRTHTWGRTYWGGALFCFMADLEIRQRTRNQRSLDDGLRAIVAAGGTIMTGWPIERVLDVADSATGVPVMRELYARWATKSEDVDLDDVWKRLGVSGPYDHLVFDDSAPLAAIRIAMTASRK